MTSVRQDDLMEVPVLKWPEIDRAMFWYTGEFADEAEDSFLVLFAENRPATSQDVMGKLCIRYDSLTGDIIGIEVDDFEQLFLVEFHPELAQGWKIFKPHGIEGTYRTEWLTSIDALTYARAIRDVAQQGAIVAGLEIANCSAS